MVWPIFWGNEILFRHGGLAMDLSCCCGCKSCCSNCYFPLSSAGIAACKADRSNSTFSESGGPSQIINFEVNNTIDGVPYQTQTQIGPSTHLGACYFDTDLQDWCVRSLCTWSIPIRIVDHYHDPGDPAFNYDSYVNIVYQSNTVPEDGGQWRMASEGVGYLWWNSFPGDPGDQPGGCEGEKTYSGTFSFGAHAYTFTTSFTMQRQGVSAAQDKMCRDLMLENQETP